VEEIRTAIESLKRAREAKLSELRAINQALEALGAAAETGQDRQGSHSFDDLGLTVAAKRYLREAGAPRTTREIADGLMERGIKTRSKNYIATVYATLHNSEAFRRTKDGTWELVEAAT
jgi:hypothetical protein